MFVSSPYVWGVLMVFGAFFFVADMLSWAKSLLLWRGITLAESAHMWYTGTWGQKLWAVILLWGCTAALVFAWFIRLGLMFVGGALILAFGSLFVR